jgi:hypothetical protein
MMQNQASSFCSGNLSRTGIRNQDKQIAEQWHKIVRESADFSHGLRWRESN